jgi:P-type Mg2+ transporter
MLELLHAGHTEPRTWWFVKSIASQTLVMYMIRSRPIPFLKSRPSLPMLLCQQQRRGRRYPAVHRASPPAGLHPLPVTFFTLLLGLVVIYLLLVELAETRFSIRQPARSSP